MTLSKCPGCHEQISSYAAACPRCGLLPARQPGVTAAPLVDAATLPLAASPARAKSLADAIWIGAVALAIAAVALFTAVVGPIVYRSWGKAATEAVMLGAGALALTGCVELRLKLKPAAVEWREVRRAELWGLTILWVAILLLAAPWSYFRLDNGYQFLALSESESIAAVRAAETTAGYFRAYRILLDVGACMLVGRALQLLNWAAATRAVVEVGRRETLSEFVTRTVKVGLK